MKQKDLFTPDGYFSLRWIREELLELKNKNNEKLFQTENQLDEIISKFWFKDRENAFIALEHIYPIFKDYLLANSNNINRFDFYKHTFNRISKKEKQDLTKISIAIEQLSKNDFVEVELKEIIKDTTLSTDWLLNNNIIYRLKDDNDIFLTTRHHTITEYFVANKMVEERSINNFKNWSTLTTPTKPPKTYFNQSWYGVASFLLESYLADETIDFFIKLGKENTDNIEQNYSEHLSRIKFSNPTDIRRGELFSLIYNAIKKSNLWISPWAEEGLASLYSQDKLETLTSDLLDSPTKLSDVVTVNNAVSVLGELVDRKVITDTQILNSLKEKLINYAKQRPDSGVLQRTSLAALKGFGDPKIITQIASVYKDLKPGARDDLVTESFLRLCYTLAPNEKQSIDFHLDALKKSGNVYAWHGLKQITKEDSLLYLLKQISTNDKLLEKIIDGENIFLDPKSDKENPLFENLTKLATNQPKKFQNYSQKIIYQACNLDSFYPFHQCIFIDFLLTNSLRENKKYGELLISNKPHDWSDHTSNKLYDLISHGVDEKNYQKTYDLLSKKPEYNIYSFIRGIKSLDIRNKLYLLKDSKLPEPIPEEPKIATEHLDEFRNRLYLDQNNINTCRTDTFKYYLQNKNQIGVLSKDDHDRLWHHACTLGIKEIDPSKFQLKINWGASGKSFNWSRRAAYYGDIVRAVKDMKPDFNFKPYRSKLISFIPFTYTEDLSTVSEIIGKATEKEIVPLNKIYLDTKNDRRYLNPESYIRFVKDLQNRGSQLSSPKSVLESFIEDDKIDEWVKISALETLPTFASTLDAKLRAKLKKIEKGSGSFASSATATLITIFKDKNSIKKRFEQIKSLAQEKRIRQFGTVYELDEDESEYSDYYIPKPLIDLMDAKLAKYFFELLSDSLQYVTNPRYEGYVQYINNTIFKYLSAIASKDNYKLVEKLEKIVGKTSLYWNYQLPQLKVLFLTRKEANGNNISKS